MNLRIKFISIVYKLFDKLNLLENASDEDLFNDVSKVVHYTEDERLDHYFVFFPESRYAGQCYHFAGVEPSIAINLARDVTEDREESIANALTTTEIHELVHWALEETGDQPEDEIGHCLKWNRVIQGELDYVNDRKT